MHGVCSPRFRKRFFQFRILMRYRLIDDSIAVLACVRRFGHTQADSLSQVRIFCILCRLWFWSVVEVVEVVELEEEVEVFEVFEVFEIFEVVIKVVWKGILEFVSEAVFKIRRWEHGEFRKLGKLFVVVDVIQNYSDWCAGYMDSRILQISTILRRSGVWSR